MPAHRNRICVASHHESLAALREDPEFRELRERPGAGYLIELRLDRYADLTAGAFERAAREFGPERLVVTYRSPEEGGARERVSDAERGGYLEQAAGLGAAFVDLELHACQRSPALLEGLKRARGTGGTKLIVSSHDFEAVPPYSRLHDLRLDAEEFEPDLVKFAVTPATIHETEPLLRLMRDASGAFRLPLLALGMGEAGLWTRVLGPRFPNPAPFTFARGEGAPGTAPGQPTWRELEALYRFGALGPDTRVLGVIGNPIGHSLSPRMHNAAFAGAGLDAVYLPFLVEGDPAAFLRVFAEGLGLAGVSVTIPHKEAILGACAEVEPLAAQIGAANTLIRRPDGSWAGSNTDADAAVGSLEEAMGGSGTLKGRKVLVLGAGGAARALAFACKSRGAEVFLHNRTAGKAENLAAAVGASCVQTSDLDRADFKVDVVVNATPVGMYPQVDQSPLTDSQIVKADLHFDTVYNPLRTKLLQRAEALGRRTLGGLAMFVGQGARQFELFTGRPAPRDLMERVVCEALQARTKG
ncbi:MAG: shikimate dehydrogenase [Planctomycetota bacterium]|nr:shikimate dehydrogenase [Planctomycetota bacterium]